MLFAYLYLTIDEYNDIKTYIPNDVEIIYTEYGKHLLAFTSDVLSHTMYNMPDNHTLKPKLQVIGNAIFKW